MRRLPPAGAGRTVRRAPPEARRCVQTGLVLAALAGAALAPWLKGAIGTPDALKLAAYGLLTFATFAALLGSAADRARLVVERMRLDVNLLLET